MSGILFVIFFLFALLYRLGLSYYRLLLIALLCQFVAFKFTDLHPLVRWSLEWIAPLSLMTFAIIKEEIVSVGVKTLFILLSMGLSLLGVWDYQNQSLVLLPNNSTLNQKTSSEETWKIFPGLPTEKSLKEENIDDPRKSVDEWEEITSQEGRFKVMSPLPAATKKETRKLQKSEIIITQTRVKDVHEGLYYVVLTTQYPENFDLPTPQVQAQVALQHLANTYEYDEVLEMEAIEHEGLEGIGFHLKRKTTGEHMMGLLLPACQRLLYQVIVFTNGDDKASELAAKFMLSFRPFPCESPKK